MKYFLDQEFHERDYKPLFGKSHRIIELISIGIVGEDGREYYAISKDFNLDKAWNNVWLRENVLLVIYNDLAYKHLKNEGSDVFQDGRFLEFDRSNFKFLLKHYGKADKEIAEDVKKFVAGIPISNFIYPEQDPTHLLFRGYRDYEEYTLSSYFQAPEFYGYYSDYDWVLFCSLFGGMTDLPKGFPMYCMDINQALVELAQGAAKRLSEFANTGMVGFDGREVFSSQWVNKMKIIKGGGPKNEDVHHALKDAKWNYEFYQYLNKL